MKFAICNEVYQDWPLEKAFAHARSLGYTGIEIAPFTLHQDARHITVDQRQKVVELARDNDLQIIGLHWLLAHTEGFHLTTDDNAIREATADYLMDLAELCSDLGGKIMVLGSPAQRNRPEGLSQEQANKNAAEVIGNIIPTLEKFDVTLALEPLGPAEGNYLLTAAEAVALIEMVKSPQVKLHLDVKAMSSEAKPIDEIIRDNARHTVHFHANDPNLLGPGMGDVDFAPIFQALRETNYDGWVSVEVFDYSPGIETLTGDSIRYMQATANALV
jgi:sugar phosphate isomerase/epimerase